MNHGGGPMPLIGHQPEVVSAFKRFVSTLPSKPSAIVVVTAHWAENGFISVSSAPTHQLYYDYGGFPPETYKLKYPAPGNPELANRIVNMISNQTGVPCRGDNKRGWDHGVFVPLMCMYPEADVPIVAVSLERRLDPALHMKIGQALSPLRDENIFIYGSGAVYHNFEYFFTTDPAKKAEGERYANMWTSWLGNTLTNPSISNGERMDLMKSWAEAPGGVHMHPRGGEEHLLPLHVLVGVAGGGAAHMISEDPKTAHGFKWDS